MEREVNLQQFFKERVQEAASRQRAEIPESVEFYLVNLLTECAKIPRLDEPLALLFAKAIQADPAFQAPLFKRLGDFSLFIAGFFPESLQKQLVGIDYYVEMGETAYGSLSQILARHSAFSEIYTSLASRFIAYVDLLSEVSDRCQIRSAQDLLRLYETWIRTGSGRAEQLLTAEGILPVRGVTLKPQ